MKRAHDCLECLSFLYCQMILSLTLISLYSLVLWYSPARDDSLKQETGVGLAYSTSKKNLGACFSVLVTTHAAGLLIFYIVRPAFDFGGAIVATNTEVRQNIQIYGQRFKKKKKCLLICNSGYCAILIAGDHSQIIGIVWYCGYSDFYGSFTDSVQATRSSSHGKLESPQVTMSRINSSDCCLDITR